MKEKKIMLHVSTKIFDEEKKKGKISFLNEKLNTREDPGSGRSDDEQVGDDLI